MTKRLPLLLSASALAVALLGSTPLGEAAQRGVSGPQHAELSGYQVVTNATANTSTSTKFIGVSCPAGKVVLGGGAQTSPAGAGVPIALNNSYRAGISWQAGARETSPYAGSWILNVVAICAN